MKIKKLEKNLNIEKSKLDGIDYPVFCFKYLQDASIKDCTDAGIFYNFLDRLKKLSALGWKEIRISKRHSFGTEKIPIKQIKPKNLPTFITPDVSHLTVFRANGNNLPFLGIQNDIIFHVIFIETKFGDIYDHGKPN